MAKFAPIILVGTLSAAVTAAAFTIALRSSTDCGDSCTAPAPQPEANRDVSPQVVTTLEAPQPDGLSETRAAGLAPSEDASKPPVASATLLAMPEKTRPEMEAKRDAIRQYLGEQTRPIFQARFDAGMAEFISEKLSYSGQPDDAEEIHGVQMRPGEGTFRSALPRSEYPELYTLHDEAARLDQLIHQKEFEEVRVEFRNATMERANGLSFK